MQQLINNLIFLINSGNANAATGEEGVADSLVCCKTLSQFSGVRPEEILPFSTGVIGERLPVQKITDAVDSLLPQLSEDNWLQAAHGIMTTDTRPKIATRQLDIDGTTVTITGIAKGAGMIQPNMATMLAYVATDIIADQAPLQAMLQRTVNRSFNRITVDSDTSTNDSCMLTATGVSGKTLQDGGQLFEETLTSLMMELAHGIVRDAEGANRFVEVLVENGETESGCLQIAYAIANSPLVKTAIFAGDANWGRIVMAIGKSGIPVDVSKLDIYIGDVRLMLGGGKDPDYVEEMGAAAMEPPEIVIRVDLGVGDAMERVWTCDLSHEYVRINAEYRT